MLQLAYSFKKKEKTNLPLIGKRKKKFPNYKIIYFHWIIYNKKIFTINGDIKVDFQHYDLYFEC